MKKLLLQICLVLSCIFSINQVNAQFDEGIDEFVSWVTSENPSVTVTQNGGEPYVPDGGPGGDLWQGPPPGGGPQGPNGEWIEPETVITNSPPSEPICFTCICRGDCAPQEPLESIEPPIQGPELPPCWPNCGTPGPVSINSTPIPCSGVTVCPNGQTFSTATCGCVGEIIKEKKKPCKGDPTTNPEIAPQKNSGINGGRFGNTRSGGKQNHGGLDIKANFGDPVFAMFDGNVQAISKEFPKAGHIVFQNATVNGENITIQYFHLQESRRFTGPVKAGDIIGYLGKSGNLGKAIQQGSAISHLHIKIKDKNGKTKNPEDFLKTKFDSKGKPTNNCK